ncbi:hypothetical protein HUX88_24830 [Duganella sp. BJB1802]|uniref:hypothetical protein n=1 Tax=Duganella sp. BJB1802 TaxID=2744575 RepID=UPI0015938C27|nr:hypothetical protein [Duganella sp. BJB1802]NVD73736.1 hypothetical protein [Duganella sp. BJB1802]
MPDDPVVASPPINRDTVFTSQTPVYKTSATYIGAFHVIVDSEVLTGGQDITIVAHTIEFTTVGILNTSGDDAQLNFVPGVKPNPQTAGQAGTAGRSGQKGNNAGNIYIFAQRIDGSVNAIARGGKGGRGEDGGDGGNGRPGITDIVVKDWITPVKIRGVNCTDEPGRPPPPGVKGSGTPAVLCDVAALGPVGEKGGSGGQAGAAGPAGNGGNVSISLGQGAPRVQIGILNLKGGEPAKPALNGIPGNSAPGGLVIYESRVGAGGKGGGGGWRILSRSDPSRRGPTISPDPTPPQTAPMAGVDGQLNGRGSRDQFVPIILEDRAFASHCNASQLWYILNVAKQDYYNDKMPLGETAARLYWVQRMAKALSMNQVGKS